MPVQLRDLFAIPSFRDGVVVGVVITALCVAAAYAKQRRPLSAAGAVLCATFVVTSWLGDVSGGRLPSLSIGLVLLLAAGPFAHSHDSSPRVFVTLLCPGALFVTYAISFTTTPWTRLFIFVYIVVAGSASAMHGRWTPANDAAPILMLITLAGVYVCTPETQHAALAVGAAVPIALTGWPTRALTLGRGGAAAFVGLVGWLAATDGVERPGAIVGAAACIGVFVYAPLLERAGASLAGSKSAHGAGVAFVIIVQLAVVGACSRVAGLESSALVSAVIACASIALGVVVVRLVQVLSSR